MKKSALPDIKREQKKSFFLHEISAFIRQIAMDEPVLMRIFVTRVELSPDSGTCYVYFSSLEDKQAFDNAFETLKLYKPSIRSALASIMQGRYVPKIVFRYDTVKEKERRVTSLLEQIAQEDTHKKG